jgi:hypothetical protein
MGEMDDLRVVPPKGKKCGCSGSKACSLLHLRDAIRRCLDDKLAALDEPIKTGKLASDDTFLRRLGAAAGSLSIPKDAVFRSQIDAAITNGYLSGDAIVRS